MNYVLLAPLHIWRQSTDTTKTIATAIDYDADTRYGNNVIGMPMMIETNIDTLTYDLICGS